MTFSVYVPGTEEKDTSKLVMSLRAIAEKVGIINSSYVSSFNARTGVVIPTQGDYPTSLIPGTTTNDSAASGNIGEYKESVLLFADRMSLTTATAADITNFSLGAGDWDVTASINVLGSGTTNFTAGVGSISNTSATLDTTPLAFGIITTPGGMVPPATTVGVLNMNVGPVRKSLSGSTTIYLVVQANFTVSTATGWGTIRARRVR